MSAFKPFLSTDVIVAPLVVNKSFSFEGTASLNNNGILTLVGLNPTNTSSLFDQSASLWNGFISGSITRGGLYNSIKQLYYTNYIPNPLSGSPYVTDLNNVVIEDYSKSDVYSRFYNYESTTLFQTNSIDYISNYGFERYFPTGSSVDSAATDYLIVLSIPRDLFGDYINPNTFKFSFESYLTPGTYFTYKDNGEGIIVGTTGDNINGIINYSHGTVIFTHNLPFIYWKYTANASCSFQSSRTIYETQYKCTIKENEFNFSLNPSLISGSTEGTVYNFVTGSYFSPYVTTVGFYNEAQELLMVAKLGQPLPTSPTTDTTILVNIDK
jgi:hypothetical protein